MKANYTKFVVGVIFAVILLIVVGIFTSKIVQVERVEYEKFSENLEKIYRKNISRLGI